MGLPGLWKLMREVDLKSLRAEAEQPFAVVVMAEALADAEALARLIGGREDSHHRWLRPCEPAPPGGPAPSADAALLLSGAGELPPSLAFAADALRDAGVPVVVVVKGRTDAADLVVRPGEAARAAVPRLDASAMTPVGQALLAAAPPTLRLALARQLPPVRPPLFTELIDQTAKANALYALTTGIAEAVPVLDLPLGVADIIVLTKNQLVMSYKIALAAGKSGSPRQVLGEVAGVIGSGFLLRQGARQLIGLVPVVGIAPKVAVAYAGTWAIGQAVVAWAADGRRLSPAAVRRFYAEARQRGRSVAQALVARAQRAPKKLSWLRRRR